MGEHDNHEEGIGERLWHGLQHVVDGGDTAHTTAEQVEIARESHEVSHAMHLAHLANTDNMMQGNGAVVPRAIQPISEGAEGASTMSRVMSTAGPILNWLGAAFTGVESAEHFGNAVSATTNPNASDPNRASDETGEGLATMFMGAIPLGGLAHMAIDHVSEHFGGPTMGQAMGQVGSTPTDLIAADRIEQGDLTPHRMGGSNAYARNRNAAEERQIQAQIHAQMQRRAAEQQAMQAAHDREIPNDVMNRPVTPQSTFVPLTGSQDAERAALGMAPIPQINL
jgi:hypothetical protein